MLEELLYYNNNKSYFDKTERGETHAKARIIRIIGISTCTVPHIDNDRVEILISLLTVVYIISNKEIKYTYCATCYNLTLRFFITLLYLKIHRRVQSEDQIVIIKRLYRARAFNLNNGTLL